MSHGHADDLLRGHEKGERSTKIVIAITKVAGEIISGVLFGTIALLAKRSVRI